MRARNTKRMVERIQRASAVRPFESDGVFDRTEVNMFTRTLVIIQIYEDLYDMKIED